MTQPNVNNEEIQVTRKLSCYPAQERFLNDRGLQSGINIIILVIVARSGLAAEVSFISRQLSTRSCT